MALVNLDLIGSLAINQGYEFRLKVIYPGNALGAAIRGKVAADYEHNGFAAFQNGIPVYNRDLDQTVFPLILSPRQTVDIPLSGEGYWVYAVQASQIGKPTQVILGGKVHCLPTVLFQ